MVTNTHIDSFLLGRCNIFSLLFTYKNIHELIQISSISRLGTLFEHCLINFYEGGINEKTCI